MVETLTGSSVRSAWQCSKAVCASLYSQAAWVESSPSGVVHADEQEQATLRAPEKRPDWSKCSQSCRQPCCLVIPLDLVPHLAAGAETKPPAIGRVVGSGFLVGPRDGATLSQSAESMSSCTARCSGIGTKAVHTTTRREAIFLVRAAGGEAGHPRLGQDARGFGS